MKTKMTLGRVVSSTDAVKFFLQNEIYESKGKFVSRSLFFFFSYTSFVQCLNINNYLK